MKKSKNKSPFPDKFIRVRLHPFDVVRFRTVQHFLGERSLSSAVLRVALWNLENFLVEFDLKK